MEEEKGRKEKRERKTERRGKERTRRSKTHEREEKMYKAHQVSTLKPEFLANFKHFIYLV